MVLLQLPLKIGLTFFKTLLLTRSYIVGFSIVWFFLNIFLGTVVVPFNTSSREKVVPAEIGTSPLFFYAPTKLGLRSSISRPVSQAGSIFSAVSRKAGQSFETFIDELVKSLKSPPPSRGRVRVGVISDCISGCNFPLPLIPSRKGRGKL
ncbi:MAG: hypothetical protein KKD68_10845, partial [Proteobacteria bacterium]|nr:hypothetical protein [Pseudomonadota bacterium]